MQGYYFTKGVIMTEYKKIHSDFVWGEIITIHSIYEYTIVEYYDRVRDGSTITKEIDYDTIRFHDPVNSCSYNSFDEALINIIAIKYDGNNSQAGYYFCKMIGMIDE